MKKILFISLFFVALLMSCCEKEATELLDEDNNSVEKQDSLPEKLDLSGVWKIKSLFANDVDYIDHSHVLDYAPDIVKSTIVFGEENTFDLSIVYMQPVDFEPYIESHKGIYTMKDKSVKFSASVCENAGKKSCEFNGVVEGDLLTIRKSFKAGELWMIPLIDEDAEVKVVFKLKK